LKFEAQSRRQLTLWTEKQDVWRRGGVCDGRGHDPAQPGDLIPHIMYHGHCNVMDAPEDNLILTGKSWKGHSVPLHALDPSYHLES
jgi:hypothetical protein